MINPGKNFPTNHETLNTEIPNDPASKNIQIYLLDRLYHSLDNCIPPCTGGLDKIKLGPESFHIRLDHLLHLLVYFLISMFYLFGIRKGITLFERHSLKKFILLILLLAIVTEVVQLWVPQRTFNVFDLVSNFAGVVIGVVLIIMVLRHEGMKA